MPLISAGAGRAGAAAASGPLRRRRDQGLEGRGHWASSPSMVRCMLCDQY